MRTKVPGNRIAGGEANSLARTGIYVFALANAQPRDIVVGRLGSFRFDRGLYLYVGSARGPGGLKARLRHHWQAAPSPRWHLDYLRARTRPAAAWIGLDGRQRECAWAARLGDERSLTAGPGGFGASDCRCPTHLFFCADAGLPSADCPLTLARRLAIVLSSSAWLDRRTLAAALGYAPDGDPRGDQQ